MSNLSKCLKDLERLKKETLRRLAENCHGECLRDSTIYEVIVNYTVLKRWIQELYGKGKYRKRVDLWVFEKPKIEDPAGYYLFHVGHHANQIRMLGNRQD